MGEKIANTHADVAVSDATIQSKQNTNEISIEQFKKIGIDKESLVEPYVKRLKKLLTLQSKKDVIRLEDEEDIEALGESVDFSNGYSLCIGLKDLIKSTVYPKFVSGVIFTKKQAIDEAYIKKHHEFFKRGNENEEETVARLQEFFANGGYTYVVEDRADNIIGSINLEKNGDCVSLFSFMVQPEWRKKGVASMMISNVYADLLANGVRYVFAKTSNKFVYYIMKRKFGGDVLWKEIYK